MDAGAGQGGTFVISWAQTEVDGRRGAPWTSLETGRDWAWRGIPVRIDGATGMPSPMPGETPELRRRRSAAGARRIVRRALSLDMGRGPAPESLDRTFVVGDGGQFWTATLIETSGAEPPLLLFVGGLPPPGRPLIVAEGLPDRVVPAVGASEGVVCFTPGTRLQTPKGARCVEELVAGDTITTRDGGTEHIVWVGSREVSGVRLLALPDLQPVRIRAGALGDGLPARDLVLSPDHRVLVKGMRARLWWRESEVLVAARDLIDGERIIRDQAAQSVTYIHVMLPAHHIVVANGVEADSFHPAGAALDQIADEQRQRLFDMMPALERDAANFGPPARRILTSDEVRQMHGAA